MADRTEKRLKKAEADLKKVKDELTQNRIFGRWVKRQLREAGRRFKALKKVKKWKKNYPDPIPPYPPE